MDVDSNCQRICYITPCPESMTTHPQLARPVRWYRATGTEAPIENDHQAFGGGTDNILLIGPPLIFREEPSLYWWAESRRLSWLRQLQL